MVYLENPLWTTCGKPRKIEQFPQLGLWIDFVLAPLETPVILRTGLEAVWMPSGTRGRLVLAALPAASAIRIPRRRPRTAGVYS